MIVELALMTMIKEGCSLQTTSHLIARVIRFLVAAIFLVTVCCCYAQERKLIVLLNAAKPVGSFISVSASVCSTIRTLIRQASISHAC